MLERSAGILLHPTSLPGPLGVGSIGAPARRFVDLLADCGIRWWQILPLNPPGVGGSPYSADSAFAGNPVLADLVELEERGWLESGELDALDDQCRERPADRYAIGTVDEAREELLNRAHGGWVDQGRPEEEAFEVFWDKNADWLDDYALFEALKEAQDDKHWRDWPSELVERQPAALRDARRRLARPIERIIFRQWTFFRQWSDLRDYAHDRGVKLIGDIPIFPAMDSSEVWAKRDLFRVDGEGQPEVVAGVPPDYFSETGQKWGNPLYRWDRLEETGFQWWMERLGRVLTTVDWVRIDHFRGFESYWEVPTEAETAETGEWAKGPGDAFFEAVAEHFGEKPFIAEDLGIITEEVEKLRDRHDLPGMKVMQFAFDGNPDHPFLPHTYPENCVAYTGTHDNDTTVGWYEKLSEEERHRVRTYLEHPDEGIAWRMMEWILASDARLAVFPAQDILGLGSEARMNTPGTTEGNWRWRMTEAQLESSGWERLRALVEASGRSANE